MATRTVSQSGPISDSATFGGSAFSNGDDIVNPPANGFTLTIDQDSTVAGFGASGAGNGNGRTIVNSGVTLTLTGNVIQGNEKFTFGSGTGNAHLIFDTTAADRKWLFGDAASFTVYSNCIFEALGTSGAHCTVSKTGSNEAWFDGFGEGSGACSDKTGWDCAYTDFEDIFDPTSAFMNGLDTFGNCHIRFDNCTFDGCGTLNDDRPYGWSGAADKDYYVRDCRFTNSTGTYSAYVIADGSSGSGTKGILRNAFDKAVNFNAKISVEDNYFGHGAVYAGGPLASNTGNLYHLGNGDSEVLPSGSSTNNYWLGHLDHPGNPHCVNPVTADSTHTYWIGELPAGLGASDSGELFYAAIGGLTITNNLSIPCAADGKAIGNVAHNSSTGSVTPWVVDHNTCAGTNNAYIAYTERASDTGILYDSLRSNLVYTPSGSTAAIAFDVSEDVTDMVDPPDAEYNGMYGQIDYADATSGETLEGYRSHFTTEPGANDIIADPQFSDVTRNFQNWAVHKGAASSGDSQATKTAAAIALLMADPTLIADDLMPWVRAGFAPTNAVYEDAGHDAVTIGAVEMAAATGNPWNYFAQCG